MKNFAALVGVGLVVCVGCGGGDDGDESSAPGKVADTIVPGTEAGSVNDTIVPGTESYDTIVPGTEGRVYSGVNPLHRGSVRQEDLALARYEYTLHGTDADLDSWLAAGDIVLERSAAGGLTYAVVRSAHFRAVPASLQP